MEILIGALIATTVLLLVDKYLPKKPIVVRQETQEEKLDREKAEKHIQAIMNYNPEKAVKRNG